MKQTDGINCFTRFTQCFSDFGREQGEEKADARQFKMIVVYHVIVWRMPF